MQVTTSNQEAARGKPRTRLNALLRLSPGALPGSASWPVSRRHEFSELDASGRHVLGRLGGGRQRVAVRCLRRGWTI